VITTGADPAVGLLRADPRYDHQVPPMNRLDQFGSSSLPHTVDTLSLSGDVAVSWLPAPRGVINLEGSLPRIGEGF
jgi:hypothetical protein